MYIRSIHHYHHQQDTIIYNYTRLKKIKSFHFKETKPKIDQKPSNSIHILLYFYRLIILS